MSLPLVTRYGADPLLDLEIANKQYVDNNSSAGNTFARVVKKVREVRDNDTTLTDDAELFISMDGDNRNYGFLMMLFYASGTTPDFSYTFTVPSGALADWMLDTWVSAGNMTMVDENFRVDVTVNSAALHMLCISGFVRMGSTAGDLTFQWAQRVSAGTDVDVFEGSYLVMWDSIP